MFRTFPEWCSSERSCHHTFSHFALWYDILLTNSSPRMDELGPQKRTRKERRKEKVMEISRNSSCTRCIRSTLHLTKSPWVRCQLSGVRGKVFTLCFLQTVRQKSIILMVPSKPTRAIVTVVSLMVPMQMATKKEW